MLSKLFFIRFLVIVSILLFFNLIFHLIYKLMKKKYKKNDGANTKKYRIRIYIFSISLTIASILLIPAFIYIAKKNKTEPSPMLYISFFILVSLVLGHMSQLIKTLGEK